MSRRKKRERASAVPALRDIRIVCTDRGRHSDVPFGIVSVWPNGENWEVDIDHLGMRMDEFIDMDNFDELHRTWPFVCRRCDRNVPLRHGNLEKILRAVAESGRDTLDISYI